MKLTNDKYLYRRILKNWRRVTKWFVFDFETTGFDPRTDKPFCYVLTDENFNSRVFRLDYANDKVNKRNIRRLKKIFEDPSIGIICHNYKFELHFLKRLFTDVNFDNVFFHDTMLLSQILQNNAGTHSLDKLGVKMLDYADEHDKELKKDLTAIKRNFTQKRQNKKHDFLIQRFEKLKDRGIDPIVKDRENYGLIDPDLMEQYQIDDGVRPMYLFKIFSEHVSPTLDDPVSKDYLTELLLVRATADMEDYGMMYFERGAEELSDYLKKELLTHEKTVRDFFGYLPDIFSTKVLQKILYDDLDLPVISYTPKGNPSTDKNTLLRLFEQTEQSVFKSIMGIRSFSNALTMISGYKKLSDNDEIIHPNILTNEAKTGRQACRNPNLQNVQSDKSLNTIFKIPARQSFRARPRKVMLFVDYSGIELRLIADAANEKRIIQVINDDGDPHLYNASNIFAAIWDSCPFTFGDVSVDHKFLRKISKSVVFGTAYGAGQTKIETLFRGSIPADDDFIYTLMDSYNEWKESFPEIGYFTNQIVDAAKRKGYVETAFGRRLQADNGREYVLSNFIIQGTAAQILKKAEIRLHRYFADKPASMVVPIHDELLIETDRSFYQKNKNELLSDIALLMCKMPELKVKMDVEYKLSTLAWNKNKGVTFCR